MSIATNKQSSGKRLNFYSWEGITGTDTEVLLYDYSSLGFAGRFPLPSVKVAGNSLAAHGKFVFFNGAGSALYAILAAADTSAKSLGCGLQENPADPKSLFLTIDTEPGTGGTITPSIPNVV